jgi:hypothetical protein
MTKNYDIFISYKRIDKDKVFARKDRIIENYESDWTIRGLNLGMNSQK